MSSMTSYTDSIVNTATYARDSIYSGIGTAKDFTVKSAYHIKDFAVATGGHVKDFAVAGGGHIKDAGLWLGRNVSWLATESWNLIANFASGTWEFISSNAQAVWNHSLPALQKTSQFLLSYAGLFGISAIASVVFTKLAIGDVKDTDERIKKVILGALAIGTGFAAGILFIKSGILASAMA